MFLIDNHKSLSKEILRHLTAVLFFAVSWKYLSEWYMYQQAFYYYIFILSFFTGLVLGLYSITKRFRGISAARIAVAGAILLLLLPWGEWLGLNFEGSSEDWSRRLYQQALFVYLLVLLLDCFPQVPETVAKKVRTLLVWISTKRLALWVPPIAFFIFSAWISFFVYRSTPPVQDSAAHLFQAKIFKTSELFAPAPPVPDFFSQKGDMLAMKDGKWFGMYQPGFAALLAAAMFLRAEWFVSPLLGALTIAIWIAYSSRWHGTLTAILFGIVALLSPFLFVMSSTIMVHSPELFIASALIYLCRRESEEQSLIRPLLIFILLVAGMLVRGFSLLAFIFPALMYTGWTLLRKKNRIFVLLSVSGILSGMLLLAAYQKQITGSPLKPGYLVEYPELHYGFGPSLVGQVHTPLRGLENTSNNIHGINIWLTGWYSGSILFLLLFCLREPKFQTWDFVLFTGILTLILFYYFYVAQTLLFGPRSYYILGPLLILFLIRSTQIEKSLSHSNATVICIFIVSLAASLPFQIPTFIQRWNPQAFQPDALKNEVERSAGQKLLVFLTDRVSQTFVNWNEPFLNSNLIFCRDLKSRNEEAIRTFPNHRPVYFTPTSGLKSGFTFRYAPEQRPEGFISAFELSMSLQASRYYPDKDSFDICYTDLLDSSSAPLQLVYLEKELLTNQGKTAYREKFRLGVLHAARLLILPLATFEESGTNWASTFDSNRFRTEYFTTLKYLKESGETGKIIDVQLQKVGKRIDKNSDGNLSDEEIRRFLLRKLKLMEAK